MEQKLFQITEFAQIARTSRKTLQYYDELDLFRPALVGENGYRYYALSQLAGFLRRESSARSFVWTADCAVILCLAAMADSLSSPGLLLLYAGCALLLSVFLLLRREGPQEAAP